MKKLLIIIGVLSISYSGLAQEEKVQALYMYNFTKFMKWDNTTTIDIGVYGNAPAFNELEAIASRLAGKLKIIKLTNVDMVTQCNMVFLPSSEKANFTAIQEKTGNLPIIIVTQDEEFIAQGAEIAFYEANNKLRFIMNKPAIDATKVKVSNTLISMAKMVN